MLHLLFVSVLARFLGHSLGILRSRWPSALKYDILSLHFPAQRSDYIFAGGMDLEVRCNLVESRARKAASHAPLNPNHSFR